MKLKLIALFLSILLVTLFALQNTEQVEVTFLLWGFSMPRALLMLTLFCIGVLFGISLSTIAGHKKNQKSK